MNNLDEKSEQRQNDEVVNASLHNQSLQADSLSATSYDQCVKCEPEELDIKPDPYFLLNQDLKQDLSLKCELSTSTLNLGFQQYQEDISMISKEECKGLYLIMITFNSIRHPIIKS